MMRIYLWLDVVQVGNMARLTFVTRCFFYRNRFLRNSFTVFSDFVQV